MSTNLIALPMTMAKAVCPVRVAIESPSGDVFHVLDHIDEIPP